MSVRSTGCRKVTLRVRGGAGAMDCMAIHMHPPAARGADRARATEREMKSEVGIVFYNEGKANS